MLLAAWLAVTRIYQVDEAQNLYMARVAAAGETHRFFTTAQLWLLGPMGWIARDAPDSATAFLWARLLFLGVFLVNIGLLAACTGVPLRSAAGLAALAAAATLAPLWDYGFEIRHDNLILLGLLLAWWSVRVRTPGPGTYAALGAASALLVFVSFKAMAYVLPLSLALLLWPPPGTGASRARLGFSWLLGAAGVAAAARLLYSGLGLWPTFVEGFRVGARIASGPDRFGPWPALARTLGQTPLLVALAAAALAVLGWDLLHRGRRALGWDGLAPEVALLGSALAALGVNPAPYPYNLVNVVPFAFLAAARLLRLALPVVLDSPPLLLAGAAAVLLGHLAPFAAATARHQSMGNERQVRLMRAAEALTDPARDPVYDGAGLVLTRDSVHYQWYIHSLNIRAFADGSLPPLRRILAERPAPVLLRSYRTDWLPAEDRAFLRSRYVPLSDELWVLGTRLPPGGGRFEVLHPGRYRVLAWAGGQGQPDPPGLLDGRPLPPGPVHLDGGPHLLELFGGAVPLVAWVGPHLELPPTPGPGDHAALFVNWY